jgi:hypothetical protein
MRDMIASSFVVPRDTWGGQQTVRCHIVADCDLLENAVWMLARRMTAIGLRVVRGPLSGNGRRRGSIVLLVIFAQRE